MLSERAKQAVKHYSKGRSRTAYRVRKDIADGLKKSSVKDGSSELGTTCSLCQSLLDLTSIFKSFLHRGKELRKCQASYTKKRDMPYYNVKEQNEFLMKSVFDAKGNYIYHRNCIKSAFGVGTARLARLRCVVQQQNQQHLVRVEKERVTRFSDVVVPMDCSKSAGAWLQSQPDGSIVSCRNHPAMHVKSLTMLRKEMFYRNIWTLWTVIPLLMVVKKVVMVQLTILILNS